MRDRSTHDVSRIYRAEPHALFGACLTALGQMQARFERHDVERGVIVALIGRGWLAPVSELTLQIDSAGPGAARLRASCRPRGPGSDRRVLPTLMQTIDGLLSQA